VSSSGSGVVEELPLPDDAPSKYPPSFANRHKEISKVVAKPLKNAIYNYSEFFVKTILLFAN
jgi:hypothetical protein